MATTTATVSISSTDLMPGSPLNINASSTLMKTGITTGMELMDLQMDQLQTMEHILFIYVIILQMIHII